MGGGGGGAANQARIICSPYHGPSHPRQQRQSHRLERLSAVGLTVPLSSFASALVDYRWPCSSGTLRTVHSKILEVGAEVGCELPVQVV